MFKVAYSYGLRFNELRHLQTVDLSGNPHAREFGRYGAVQVRYGKAKKGSPPKRGGVLTVFKWTPEVITDWLAHGKPCLDDGLDLFPSERGALVAENTLLRRSAGTAMTSSCRREWICTRCAARMPRI